mmetsp:Transcript_1813/g.5272  ORF Transcript_1813/g.5272 Transcript_1813/m.5272 type:complete len:559 (-) Transcript_1813:404-2080(-)
MGPLRALLALPVAASSVMILHRHSEAPAEQAASKVFDIIVSVCLVIIAGLASGLTLGLMSMDHVDLEVLKRSGSDTEKKHAARIAPVLERQHLLLVTLLLVNAAAMEALPIFIDKLTDPVTAIVLSVTVVLTFGEIIPQAVCSRYGLAVGSYSAWLVRILMFVCFPVAWPISKLLDYLLGSDHSALFRRGQLKALVDVHGAQSGMGGFLTPDEISVIRGALDLTSKSARVAMTSLDTVFMLSSDSVLDGETLARILRMGHSRVPVHQAGDRSHLLGVVLVKELVLLDPDDRVRVDCMRIRQVPFLSAGTPMYDLLRLFQTGRSHMVFLRKPPADEDGGAAGGQTDVNVHSGGAQGPAGTVAVTIESAAAVGSDGEEDDPEELTDFEKNAAVGDVVGIITIEDVIEELIGEEIVDETDTHVDNDRKQRVNATQQARRLPESLRTALKLDRPKSPKQSFSAQRRRERQSKPPVGITLSRGNSGTGLPDGSHADALLNPTPSLRRASTGRAPIDDRKRLRRSYTDEGMDPHEPLLVGSDYDSDHDSSRADSGRGSHSHGGR